MARLTSRHTAARLAGAVTAAWLATMGAAQAQLPAPAPVPGTTLPPASTAGAPTEPTPASQVISASYSSTAGADEGDTGFSVLPWTRRGYFGIDLGQSRYSTGCGFGGYRCKNPDLAGRVHVGGMFNRHVGVELAYLHMGNADRAGGTTSAQGLNLSLLGRLPLGNWQAFAKVGATYGRTKVTADALAGLPTGVRKGWGPGWGAGVAYELGRHSALVVEYDRHEFNFQGQGRRAVEMTTLGYRHQF
ncbi:outer membrane beta-barrel protein [Ideonella sp.]|uniref:outer membrane beta-barrel protein n=1 Tax=Ideonella sp. TaxID=1929293 RepID=UPI0035B15E3F